MPSFKMLKYTEFCILEDQFKEHLSTNCENSYLREINTLAYRTLEIVRYMDRDAYETEYARRIQGYGTLITDFEIHPFDRHEGFRVTTTKNRLFVVAIDEIQMLQETIYLNAARLYKLSRSLPHAAHSFFIRNTIIDEILSTNGIEGVSISRKEAAEAVDSQDKQKRRFGGMARCYQNLFRDTSVPLASVEEIREIYDELLEGEIAANNKPNGKLFREQDVKGIRNGRIIHRGSHGERIISMELAALIRFLNQDPLPLLIKIMVAHYYFEYIHPFYDGNGRTGRYIVARYLASILDPFTSSGFSHMLLDRKKEYYAAFDSVSKEANRGEATIFVKTLLDLVAEGQNNLIDRLTLSRALLDRAHTILESLKDIDELQLAILSLLSQNAFFQGEMTDAEIAKQVLKSRQTVSARLADLVAKGYVVVERKYPKAHRLSDALMAEITSSGEDKA
ncbi:MAG: Fic family protein [Bacillota bacterium]|nr:Fic family protein [Bacillota bacterium]